MTRSAEILDSENAQAPPGGTLGRPRRVLIHLFVAFHLTAIVCWSLTSSESAAPLNQMLRSRLAPYVIPLGFGQQWDMFAPNPPLSNNLLEAEVTLADGTRTTWRFPRMEEMSKFERYRSERHRKWASERVVAFGRPLAPVADAAARYAARQVGRPDNPARKVELVRYRSQTPSPRTRLRPYDEPARDWERSVIYVGEFDADGRVTRRWLPGGDPATQPQAAAPAATQPAAVGRGGEGESGQTLQTEDARDGGA